MAEESYPLPVFHFAVDIGGGPAAFSEVTGLNAEIQVIEYRHGLMKEATSLKMPGLRKLGNVTLKRGVLKADSDLFGWFQGVHQGGDEKPTPERRTVTVVLRDETDQPVMKWLLQQAWPAKMAAPDFKASGNEVAIESVELAYEGLRVENV